MLYTPTICWFHYNFSYIEIIFLINFFIFWNKITTSLLLFWKLSLPDQLSYFCFLFFYKLHASMFLSSPARCTGVRPYCLSVVRGDAPWLRRVWTQSEWPRRAASARAVLPNSSPWSTSLSPCSSTSRAWAWPWYAWRETLLFKNVNLKKIK